ncbi:flagellar export chaperone FliS [Paenibacillus sp. FSL W7-1332]|uniref:flagellar export chaperone FliS n=1 Tax=Paenibacillus sp. FSL W7-1332 TaxID=2921702 RepID=UPI0030CFAB30
MLQRNYQQQYQKMQVETASPGELTLLLYQEIIKSLLNAKDLFSREKYQEMREPIYKAQRIINELIITLDMEHEISHQLYQLYHYHNRRLADFLLKKDLLILEEVITFAREITETWKQALAILKSGVSRV